VRVVADGRPLQPGFKAHRERGIGRYAKNLLLALARRDDAPELELVVQRNLADPDLLSELPRLPAGQAPQWLPGAQRLITHYGLIRRTLAASWAHGAVVHFLSHLDSPARLGARTVLTVHDLIAQRMVELYGQDKSGVRFRAERWLETRCLYGAAAIIVPSECTRRDLADLYGVDPGRVRVIPEAADPELRPVDGPAEVEAVLRRHGLAGGAPYLFYLGGIDQRKDWRTLLAALAGLKGRRPGFCLALAGRIEGDRQYPRLQAEIARLGLEEEVRLLGFVPDADLPALFGGAAAFVFPSLYEGFGLPPLEAMACGAPVVAARAAAVPEVVGEAGLLVEPGRPRELAEALEALLSRPELARRLSHEGRKRSTRFSWERTAEQTLEVYREVAHG
jgi:glycosyltransferase involved in cell wall biosynthesis